MSSQRGNCTKSGPQKHKNITAYRNDLHRKKDKTIKILNSLQIVGCCKRCKEVIEWKIKYNKYKHLARPKKCVKCLQKSVTNSYYIICQNCIESQNLCGKCALVPPVDLPPAESSVASEINTKSKIVSDKRNPEEEEDDSDSDEDDSELDNEIEKVLTINDDADNQVKHKKKGGAKSRNAVRLKDSANQKVRFEDSTSEDKTEDDETAFSVDDKKSEDKDRLKVDKGRADEGRDKVDDGLNEDKETLDANKDKLNKSEDNADRNKLSSSVKKGEDDESELDDDEDDDDEDGDEDDDGGDEAEDEDEN